MTTVFTKKQIVGACAFAAGAASLSFANAQIASKDSAHPADSGQIETARAFGLCSHTGPRPISPFTPECDLKYVSVLTTMFAGPFWRAQEALPLGRKLVITMLAPPPRSGEKITIGTDTLFDFDKALLRPEGRLALDSFISKMKGINAESILAVGHADRLGPGPYNQRLSEQRVEAVKAYLVDKGIEPGRVNTEGRGETQPVTKAGTCEGPLSARVIACLQPDRRVDLEVVSVVIAE